MSTLLTRVSCLNWACLVFSLAAGDAHSIAEVTRFELACRAACTVARRSGPCVTSIAHASCNSGAASLAIRASIFRAGCAWCSSSGSLESVCRAKSRGFAVGACISLVCNASGTCSGARVTTCLRASVTRFALSLFYTVNKLACCAAATRRCALRTP